ncbi:MAG: ABC transporter permease [Actinomycetota bacterium]|nr:ABC transporter permease [Actinomycetota bacterium]
MTADRGLARFRSVALGVAWRNLHNFLTNPSLLLPALLFPLFFFTAFAGGLSRIDQAPGFDYTNGYTAFEFAFVVLQASAFGGVFTGFGIARDFESGFGRRLMLAAPNRYAIVVGYAMSALVRASLVVALLFAIAMLSGMDVSSDAVQLGGLIGLAMLVNVAATMWSTGVALRFRSIQAGPLMQTPTFLILFLAPVYVPLDLLTSWIHAVASINPITPSVEANRNLIAGNWDGIGIAVLAGFGMLAFFLIWAVTGMRRAEAAGG